jgi:hypothetical protein
VLLARRAALLALAASSLLVTGCPATDPTQGLQTGAAGTVLDYNTFVCDVMPTLVRRCSYMACHGNADHALRIYSPGKLRIGDPLARDSRDAPLTADEIDRNFASAEGMARAASPTDRMSGRRQKIPILQKALSARFGGDEHQRVGIFPVFPHATPDDDPEWLLLVNWVGGAKIATNPLRADCAAFFQSLGVSPR